MSHSSLPSSSPSTANENSHSSCFASHVGQDAVWSVNTAPPILSPRCQAAALTLCQVLYAQTVLVVAPAGKEIKIEQEQALVPYFPLAANQPWIFGSRAAQRVWELIRRVGRLGQRYNAHRQQLMLCSTRSTSHAGGGSSLFSPTPSPLCPLHGTCPPHQRPSSSPRSADGFGPCHHSPDHPFKEPSGSLPLGDKVSRRRRRFPSGEDTADDSCEASLCHLVDLLQELYAAEDEAVLAVEALRQQVVRDLAQTFLHLPIETSESDAVLSPFIRRRHRRREVAREVIDGSSWCASIPAPSSTRIKNEDKADEAKNEEEVAERAARLNTPQEIMNHVTRSSCPTEAAIDLMTRCTWELRVDRTEALLRTAMTRFGNRDDRGGEDGLVLCGYQTPQRSFSTEGFFPQHTVSPAEAAEATASPSSSVVPHRNEVSCEANKFYFFPSIARLCPLVSVRVRVLPRPAHLCCSHSSICFGNQQFYVSCFTGAPDAALPERHVGAAVPADGEALSLALSSSSGHIFSLFAVRCSESSGVQDKPKAPLDTAGRPLGEDGTAGPLQLRVLPPRHSLSCLPAPAEPSHEPAAAPSDGDVLFAEELLSRLRFWMTRGEPLSSDSSDDDKTDDQEEQTAEASPSRYPTHDTSSGVEIFERPLRLLSVDVGSVRIAIPSSRSAHCDSVEEEQRGLSLLRESLFLCSHVVVCGVRESRVHGGFHDAFHRMRPVAEGLSGAAGERRGSGGAGGTVEERRTLSRDERYTVLEDYMLPAPWCELREESSSRKAESKESDKDGERQGNTPPSASLPGGTKRGVLVSIRWHQGEGGEDEGESSSGGEEGEEEEAAAAAERVTPPMASWDTHQRRAERLKSEFRMARSSRLDALLVDEAKGKPLVRVALQRSCIDLWEAENAAAGGSSPSSLIPASLLHADDHYPPPPPRFKPGGTKGGAPAAVIISPSLFVITRVSPYVFPLFQHLVEEKMVLVDLDGTLVDNGAPVYHKSQDEVLRLSEKKYEAKLLSPTAVERRRWVRAAQKTPPKRRVKAKPAVPLQDPLPQAVTYVTPSRAAENEEEGDSTPSSPVSNCITELLRIRPGIHRILFFTAVHWGIPLVLVTKSSRPRTEAILSQLLDPFHILFPHRFQRVITPDDSEGYRWKAAGTAPPPQGGEGEGGMLMKTSGSGLHGWGSYCGGLQWDTHEPSSPSSASCSVYSPLIITAAPSSPPHPSGFHSRFLSLSRAKKSVRLVLQHFAFFCSPAMMRLLSPMPSRVVAVLDDSPQGWLQQDWPLTVSITPYVASRIDPAAYISRNGYLHALITSMSFNRHALRCEGDVGWSHCVCRCEAYSQCPVKSTHSRPASSAHDAEPLAGRGMVEEPGSVSLINAEPGTARPGVMSRPYHVVVEEVGSKLRSPELPYATVPSTDWLHQMAGSSGSPLTDAWTVSSNLSNEPSHHHHSNSRSPTTQKDSCYRHPSTPPCYECFSSLPPTPGDFCFEQEEEETENGMEWSAGRGEEVQAEHTELRPTTTHTLRGTTAPAAPDNVSSSSLPRWVLSSVQRSRTQVEVVEEGTTSSLHLHADVDHSGIVRDGVVEDVSDDERSIADHRFA